MVTYGLARYKPVAQLIAHNRLSANLSASQKKTYRMCKRKWAMEKVYGIRQRDKYHFVIGHALHSVADRYLSRSAKSWAVMFPPGWDKGLQEGDNDWVQHCAEQAISKGIWQSSAGLQVEYPLLLLVGDRFRDERGLPLAAQPQTFDDDKGVRRIGAPTQMLDGSPLLPGWDELPPVVGFIDQLDLTGALPWVVDHKTSKSKRWVLSSAKLGEDTQMNMYSALALGQRKDVDSVRLRHNVFLKGVEDDTTAYNVDATTDLATVVQHWGDTIAVAKGMQEIRSKYPKIIDTFEPSRRADNSMLVPSAIDEGNAKEACNAYGGCPYRDMCQGRVTPQQIVRRLDAPDMTPLARKPIPIYGLRSRLTAISSKPLPLPLLINPSTQPDLNKDTSMPFTPKTPIADTFSITLYKIVYLLDPDNAAVQYRGKVVTEIDADTVVVFIAPHLEIDASEMDINEIYLVELPRASLSTIQFPDAVLTGYGEALVAAGIQGDTSWQTDTGTRMDPRAPASTITPATTPADVVAPVKDTRPPRDSKFGLNKGQALPPAASKGAATGDQMQRAQAAIQAAQNALPEPTFEPAMGMRVQFAPTTHPFFCDLVGKFGLISDVSEGETQPVVSVTLDDGSELPDVAIGRFVAAPSGGITVPDALLMSLNQYMGKEITVTQEGGPPPTTFKLDAVENGVIKGMNGELSIPLGNVTAVQLYTPPPPKLTAEQKKAQKAEDKKAAEEAAMPQDLDMLIESIQSTLASGKVTKKVVEGILTALEYIKSKGPSLPNTAHAQATPAPVVPPLYSAAEICKKMDEIAALSHQAKSMVS